MQRSIKLTPSKPSGREPPRHPERSPGAIGTQTEPPQHWPVSAGTQISPLQVLFSRAAKFPGVGVAMATVERTRATAKVMNFMLTSRSKK